MVTSGDGSADNQANTFEGLDVRGFNYIYDSVGDNWDRLQGVNGAVKVYIDDGDFEVDVVINAEKAEDSAHNPGDIGNYVLAVRQDTLASSVDTDGDYGSFKINALGELYVKDTDALGKLTDIETALGGTLDVNVTNASISVTQGTDPWIIGDGGNSITVDGSVDAVQSGTWTVGLSEDKNYGVVGANTLRTAAQIGNATGAADFGAGNTSAQTLRAALADDTSLDVNDAALANTAIAHSQQAATADDTAESTVDIVLANRKYLYLANEGNKVIAVGGAGVTITSTISITTTIRTIINSFLVTRN